jgi:DNA-binding NarL/FixJ family response regulator
LLNGIDVALRASKEHPRTRILILSMHGDDEFVRRALGGGAAGYLAKNADRAELEMAVRAVARGDTWLSPAIAKSIATAYAHQSASTVHAGGECVSGVLTPRQREVLKLIAEGLSTKEIAAHLDRSIKTIETHRAEMMDRLGIHSVAGLVRYAIRLGLVQLEP